MSATEHDGQFIDSIPAERSSVQIDMDSKGLAKVRVKVYVGEDETALTTARVQAINTFNLAKAAVAA